ncbi:hypothetical protein BH20ACI3_BH20ACI3_34840 [soil metagenome]
MKRSVKTQTTRDLKRNQFAELSKGIEALAEARQGKRTPQAHTVESGARRKSEDSKSSRQPEKLSPLAEVLAQFGEKRRKSVGFRTVY